MASASLRLGEVVAAVFVVIACAVVLHKHDVRVHEFGLGDIATVRRGEFLVGGGQRLNRLCERCVLRLQRFLFCRHALQLRLLGRHVILRLADRALGGREIFLELFNRLRLLREFVLCRLQLLLCVKERLLERSKAFLALFQIRLPQAKRHPL